MASPGSPPTCVFCGREIGADEPTSGRPPMAAHASCADAALADDRHWDAIASREPDAGDEEPATQPAGTDQGRTAGCLPVLAAGIAVGMLVGFAPL